jgi:hypothetical protein
MSLLKIALCCTLLGNFGVSSRDTEYEEYVSRRTDQGYYKDSDGRLHLKIDSKGELRIMQLTDLHFGED